LSEQIVYNAPGPIAQAFHDSDAFIRGLLGPVGSGKSSTCVMEIIKHTFKQVAFDGRAPRALGCDPKHVPRVEVHDDQDVAGVGARASSRRSSGTRRSRHGHASRWRMGRSVELEVLFLALDKESDTGKLKSLELTGAWLNEASEIPVEIHGDGDAARRAASPRSVAVGRSIRASSWTRTRLTTIIGGISRPK
jgi:hypothetical protein